MKRFIDECQLRSTWEDFNIDFSHYQEINGVSYVSTIDHFFINESFNFLVDSGVLHDPSNMSDHCPIYCKIELEGIKEDSDISQMPAPSKPRWKQSTPTEKRNFKLRLDYLLTCLGQQ